MKADVAVVGAGALGLSMALHCALLGRTVVVLDRRAPGSQASGRAAGPVPQVPGLWVASGCNGSGFSSSPAIGEALARWITGGRPEVDRSALSPARFAPSATGPLTDEVLVERGGRQYAHYYDPLTV